MHFYNILGLHTTPCRKTIHNGNCKIMTKLPRNRTNKHKAESGYKWKCCKTIYASICYSHTRRTEILPTTTKNITKMEI